MKVLPATNKISTPQFGFKIEAPEDFWWTVKNPNRSKEMVDTFTKSLEKLQSVHNDKTLCLKMDREADGWDTDFIYRAIIKENHYETVAEQKNGGWVELIIKTAKEIQALIK